MVKNRGYLAVVVASTLGFVSPVAAQGSDEIVVTGSRTDQGFEALGGSIVESDEIERALPGSLDDVLDVQAGLYAFEKGGPGGGSYVGLRGAEPNFTAIQIEGARVNDPTNSQGGAFDLSQIDPLVVEQIEIARGALGAVQGADALSGVVNIRIARPGGDTSPFAARSTIDTNGAIGGGVRAAVGGEQAGLLVGASVYDSGDLAEDVDFSRWQLLGRGHYAFADYALSLTALHSEGERRAFPEDSGGPLLAANRQREARETAFTLASLEFSVIGTPNLAPRLRTSWSRQDADIDTPAIFPGALDGVPAIESDTRFDRIEAIGDLTWRPSDIFTLAAGLGYLHERGRGNSVVDFGFPIPADFVVERDMASIFAEATLMPIPQISITGGLRYDDASSESGEWTGRGAVRVAPFADGPEFYVVLSEGYKLPSLFALAYPLIANPDLLPERGRTFEVGVRMPVAELGHVRLTWFDGRYTDLIDFDPALFTNVNRSRVDTSGFEAEGQLTIADNVRAIFALTYLDTETPAGTPPLRSRPQWQGHVGADWSVTPNIAVGASAEYIGGHFDSSIPTGLVERDDYAVFDVHARWSVTEAIELVARIENLFDAAYQRSVGVLEPGVHGRLGVFMRW